MYKILRIAFPILILLLLSLACQLIPSAERTYQNEDISFTIPAGWQTLEEVWDRPASPGKDFKGLGVQEIVTIQYPPNQGKGKAFFVVASSPLLPGDDLETRFTQAYQSAVPEIEKAATQAFDTGELTGYKITYKRPWGEPWWKFQDIWLEKNGVIYVLSFYASPTSFDTYTDTLDQIVGSFQIQD